eukprot:scaffold87028_cov61-Phaeocystis_antarctica.AAC.3
MVSASTPLLPTASMVAQSCGSTRPASRSSRLSKLTSMRSALAGTQSVVEQPASGGDAASSWLAVKGGAFTR